jgi:hypothetical protein
VCTSFALVITNIKNNIPFVLEMEKDHYTMWAELFEVHARAHKVIDHIIPQPEKEKFASTDASFDMWTILIQLFFNEFIPPYLLIFYHHYGKTIHCHGCLESFG